jgi:hypothetical protein
MRYAIWIALWAAPCFAVTDSITLTNNTGSTVANYPLQFARPFVRGEIANYPQLGLCTNPTCASVSAWFTTQADVKVHWDDGSVKHAIVSVVIPSVKTGATHYLFRNQTECNCGTGETKQQMLSDPYNFDARMEFTQNGATKTASARSILNDAAQTTLMANIAAGARSLTVANAQGFPAPPFPITVGAETMNVTSKGNGVNWTVVRGYDGAPAVSHAAGEQVSDQRVQYWIAGTVATTVEIGDLSPSHLYDLGWQPAHVMTLAAPVAAAGTAISVVDARGVNAPFYARMFRSYASANLSNGTASEDVYICSINTATTPHQLIVGPVGCANSPAPTGRHVRGTTGFAFAAGDQIHPDTYWQEPSTDIYKSIKPLFYATFWPSLHKVSIRVVAEIADTQRLQDQVYDLVAKTGAKAPVTFYSSHHAQRHATRFTRTAWVGTAPPVIDITHNVAYLSSTSLMWNWDPAKKPSTTFMDTLYAAYDRKPHESCGDGGSLQRAMGVGGARPEIAPEDLWFVEWLYTGYGRMRTVAFGNADLASCGWTVHFREGNPAKHLDRELTVSGFGKPMSTSERRSNSLYGYNFPPTAVPDRVVPVGPFSNGGWTFDGEHLVNLHLPLYVVTGDHFYLEEGLFYESSACNYLNGSAVPPATYGRGPTGSECWVVGSLRAQAWNLRYKSELAVYLPDSMAAEKRLSKQYVADALAPLEATLGLPNSNPADAVWTTMYNYGLNYTARQVGFRVNGSPSPMGLLRADQGAAFAEENYGIDNTFAGGATSLFEMGYFTLTLGLTRDLGLYPKSLNKILGFAAGFYNKAATDPGFNPFLLAAGRVPTVYKSNGRLINNWADMKKGYWADFNTAKAKCRNCSFPIWQGLGAFPLSSPEGYDVLSAAAISQLADQPDGAKAWSFASRQMAKNNFLNDSPQWYLLPRAAPKE